MVGIIPPDTNLQGIHSPVSLTWLSLNAPLLINNVVLNLLITQLLRFQLSQ